MDKFNLDALAVESNGEPFVFTFGGEDYTIPPYLDLRVGEALRKGDWSAAMHLLLGDEQWERILASDAVLDLTRASALVDAFATHIGSTVGESSASSSSSNGTARPSKRTSPGTTKSR